MQTPHRQPYYSVLARLVALFCDTGERYLSKVHNDAWLIENDLAEEPA